MVLVRLFGHSFTLNMARALGSGLSKLWEVKEKEEVEGGSSRRLPLCRLRCGSTFSSHSSGK